MQNQQLSGPFLFASGMQLLISLKKPRGNLAQNVDGGHRHGIAEGNREFDESKEKKLNEHQFSVSGRHRVDADLTFPACVLI